MKQFKQFLSLLLFAIVLSGCATGYTTYKHGDYYKACLESVERLRINSHSEKAAYVLNKAYPMAKKTAQREIENAQIANQTNQFDILVYQYERMNQLANAIYACPKANEIIAQPVEFIAELSNAKQMAAEQAYNMGIKAIEANTIEQARIGFQFFNKANEYVAGYKDVINKIEEARYYATLRVVVQRPITSNRYQYSADFFYDNLLAEMTQVTKNRFVRFYSPEEAANENMKNPHQFIALNFEDFSVGNVRETTNTVDVKRDSVIVGTVKVEGKTYNTYNTVKAKLTTFRQEISSGGVLSLRVVDAQNSRELQLRNFNGQYVWNTNWSTYQGDDRALTNEQKNMCGRKAQMPPAQQELFVQFTKPIYTQVVSYIRTIYSKY